jgi:hypothetical protein
VAVVTGQGAGAAGRATGVPSVFVGAEGLSDLHDRLVFSAVVAIRVCIWWYVLHGRVMVK